ncbi:MAG TPA: ankyrin repeat domain-containing protein [Acidothermaceae bacterium]|jgi:ankyrin repeat protein|nr:ankyrin repeat domain-containing protein [Acidothermaceae bacterium]
MADESALMRFVRVIAAGDVSLASQLLASTPSLATEHLGQGATRQVATDFYLHEIEHYVYGGDTALHVAAAGYQLGIARSLVAAGADVSAKNRRGAQPLHYAAEGHPATPAVWKPEAQAAMIAYLIEAGADPNATDKSGVAPLHRAVRTRSAAAVRALIDGGADPRRPNRNGSTPMTLATQNTGRGGSGTPESKAQQREIVQLLELQRATQ